MTTEKKPNQDKKQPGAEHRTDATKKTEQDKKKKTEMEKKPGERNQSTGQTKR